MEASPTKNHNEKPMIPALEIYKKTTNNYQIFVNRFCHSLHIMNKLILNGH